MRNFHHFPSTQTIFKIQKKEKENLTNNKNLEGFVILPIKRRNILIGKHNKKSERERDGK